MTPGDQVVLTGLGVLVGWLVGERVYAWWVSRR